MIPSRFDYVRPDCVEALLAQLAQAGGEARVLAGGQTLLPQLKTRRIAPRLIVDIASVEDLAPTNIDGGVLTVSPKCRQAELLSRAEVLEDFPLFAAHDLQLSDPIVRNCGTLVGALAAADPGADWTAIALVLDATVHAQAPNGGRTVPIKDFFRDSFTTALEPGEFITQVSFPRAPPRVEYLKLRHPASGYALVGVAAALDLDGAGRCRTARIAVTGAGRWPVRVSAAEARLTGERLSPAATAEAAELAAEAITYDSDLHAGPEHRRRLVRTYVARALRSAAPTFH